MQVESTAASSVEEVAAKGAGSSTTGCAAASLGEVAGCMVAPLADAKVAAAMAVAAAAVVNRVVVTWAAAGEEMAECR